jgi:hypothetical protein
MDEIIILTIIAIGAIILFLFYIFPQGQDGRKGVTK